MRILSWLALAAGVGGAPERPGIAVELEGLCTIHPGDAPAWLAIAAVERGRMRVEGRYNYEAFRTGSLFLGERFDLARGSFELRLTPILGMVLGRVNGAALGLELEAEAWKLELSSQSELVVDGTAPDRSFFYVWSELAFRPIAWARVGLVGQRTRLIGERALDHGLLVGLDAGPVHVGAYLFQPFGAERYVAFALAGRAER